MCARCPHLWSLHGLHLQLLMHRLGLSISFWKAELVLRLYKLAAEVAMRRPEVVQPIAPSQMKVTPYTFSLGKDCRNLYSSHCLPSSLAAKASHEDLPRVNKLCKAEELHGQPC